MKNEIGWREWLLGLESAFLGLSLFCFSRTRLLQCDPLIQLGTYSSAQVRPQLSH